MALKIFILLFILFSPMVAFSKKDSRWRFANSFFEKKYYYSSLYTYIELLKKFSSHEDKKKIFMKISRIDQNVKLNKKTIFYILSFFNEKDMNYMEEREKDFFYYYNGLKFFSLGNIKEAIDFLKRVSDKNYLKKRALFSLASCYALKGEVKAALSLYQSLIPDPEEHKDDKESEFLDQVYLNIARLYYEKKSFHDAIYFYSKVSKESIYWLDSLEESSWVFFLLEKANNALGNIHTVHSPFFENHFYPESYIIQSANYLRLCLHDRAKSSIKLYEKKYQPLISKMGDIDMDNPIDYLKKNQRKDPNLLYLIDLVIRNKSIENYEKILIDSDEELKNMKKKSVVNFLKKERALGKSEANKNIKRDIEEIKSAIQEFSEQSKMIEAEILLGKVDEMRLEVNPNAKRKEENFIGGMISFKNLKVGSQLEYWPFQGEYWEDELGGYVYNINSRCK
jgi:tetratricopeptide (TPR) repeat protein